jgi:hypothetical protein
MSKKPIGWLDISETSAIDLDQRITPDMSVSVMDAVSMLPKLIARAAPAVTRKARPWIPVERRPLRHDDYVVTMITDGPRPTRYVGSVSPGEVPNVARMSRSVFIERGLLQ